MSESDKGEGRGLPVGWGPWQSSTIDPYSIDTSRRHLLYRDGASAKDFVASAYPNGQWWIFREHCDEDAPPLDGGTAQPRPGESAGAAAQAAAEAALWATDGYGVGEVRGRFVAAPCCFDRFGLTPPVPLDGLSGRWNVTAIHHVEGGVEVDAVRAPVPVDKAARAWASIGQIADDGSHPVDAVRAPAVGPDEHSDECAYYFADAGDADALCDCGKGEPAPCEPSAPTDGDELARLLPGLERDMARMMADVTPDRRYKHESTRVDRVLVLLLAERERVSATLQALFSDVASPTELATHTVELLEEAARETDKLRARVEEAERRIAELEVAHASASVFERRTSEALLAKVAELEAQVATPPPHTVAALLRAVEELRAEQASDAEDATREEDWGSNAVHSARAGAYDEAASLIRATLGAPSPLAIAREDLARRAIHLAVCADVLREERDTVKRLEALACDAAKEPT